METGSILRASLYKFLVSLPLLLFWLSPPTVVPFVSLYITLICLLLPFLLLLSVDTEHYIHSTQQLSQVTLVCFSVIRLNSQLRQRQHFHQQQHNFSTPSDTSF
jgi:hypothetical protein